MGVMTTKEVSHREEIVVCDKVENKEVGGEEKDNPYTKKTELWRVEDVLFHLYLILTNSYLNYQYIWLKSYINIESLNHCIHAYITLNFFFTFFTLLWIGIIDYNLSIVNHIIIDNNVTQLVVVDSAKPCISQAYSKLSSTHNNTSYWFLCYVNSSVEIGLCCITNMYDFLTWA